MKNFHDHVKSIYSSNLTHLENGVLTPGFKDAEVGQYIHAIFNTSEGAAGYARRFKQNAYFSFHLKRALSEGGLIPKNNALILDVGSGSGNTVFPALEIFKDSKIVATDLSTHLLGIILQSSDSSRICAVQENAEELNFKPSVFDYVIGGAILHHLFYPDRAISRVMQILKSGGCAFFFEPCMNGQVILKMAYERVAMDERSKNLDPEIKKLLKRQINFINLRLRYRADKNIEIFKKLEDKWFFSKNYLENASIKGGASRVTILPLDTPSNPVESKMRSNFHLLNATPPNSSWIWEVAREIDESLPPDFRNENPAGLTIIFHK